MKTLCATVLAMSLAGCASLPHREIGGVRFEETRNCAQGPMTACRIPRERLATTLAALANRDEFQIAYLPAQELALDITENSVVNGSTAHIDVLFTLLEQGMEVELLHNHSNQGLDPQGERIGRPLYWIAPSISDIGQYLGIGPRGAQFRYRIASQYGLLTMSTSKDTFDARGNIYFQQALPSVAAHMQTTLEGVDIAGLQEWARRHRGWFSLSFEPAAP